MPTNPLPPALVSGALIALLRDAQQLRAFVDDLVDVGGEERRGPYSAQAKWQNVKLRAAKLVESASAALSASRTPTTITAEEPETWALMLPEGVNAIEAKSLKDGRLLSDADCFRWVKFIDLPSLKAETRKEE